MQNFDKKKLIKGRDHYYYYYYCCCYYYYYYYYYYFQLTHCSFQGLLCDLG
jgi:hypothetical protein